MAKPTTLEEVMEAYQNLSDEDRKNFEQTIADRVHESIGEQEAENGEKDSQTAEDREHEALGAEHADGEGEVEELHETDEETAHEEEQEEKHDESEQKDEQHDSEIEALRREIAEIKQMLSNTSVAEAGKDIYGLGSGVFVADTAEEKPAPITGKKVAEIIQKIKR